MKLHKKYFANLALAFIFALASSFALAGVNDSGWLIGVSAEKSFKADTNEIYEDDDLEIERINLSFEYKNFDYGNYAIRHGLEISSINLEIESDQILIDYYNSQIYYARVTNSFDAVGVYYTGKLMPSNETFNPYLGYRLGMVFTSDFDDETTFGLGIGSTFGLLTKLTNNLELDLGLNINTTLMQQVNYCTGYYCSSYNPIYRL